MRITGASVFDVQNGFVCRDLCTDGAFISTTSGDDAVVEADGCWLIPGLTDLHFHGCRGEDFSDGSAEGLAIMADYELSRGVTQICPAGMTLDRDALLAMCANASRHQEEARHGADLVGINLEGPFLSQAKKGAQNGAWLREPDEALFQALQSQAKGLVKLVSVAPELPGALDFIRQVGDRVCVSIAHTEADYETALAAFQAGARQVTHLYNAMPPFGHRAPGVVGAAFDTPESRVELICDGVHIHPSVVRATFRMFGPDRVILISDTMRAAGMPDGDYTLGGQEVHVEGRRATLKDGTLAGSATDLMACMVTAVEMGIPLYHAVKAAAVNPARAIGIYSRVGSLEPGKRANLVLLERELKIKAVIFHGEILTSTF